MFEHMHMKEPYQDDLDMSWNIMVTGEDPTDYLFTVHSMESADAVTKRAAVIIMAIQTYTNANKVVGEMMGLQGDKHQGLFDFIATRRLESQGQTESVQMRSPKLDPDIKEMVRKAIKGIDETEGI